MKLYHATNTKFDSIRDDHEGGCVAGGIFAVTVDHLDSFYGDIVCEIEADKVATADDIAEHADMIRAEMKNSWAFSNVEDDDVVYAIINDQPNNAGLENLGFDGDDWNDAAWEMQRILGKVAKTLGYDAVECSDGIMCFSSCRVKLLDMTTEEFLEENF